MWADEFVRVEANVTEKTADVALAVSTGALTVSPGLQKSVKGYYVIFCDLLWVRFAAFRQQPSEISARESVSVEGVA
jgi:hypothetical protein